LSPPSRQSSTKRRTAVDWLCLLKIAVVYERQSALLDMPAVHCSTAGQDMM
jgi:hypothetical protein